MHTGTFQCGHCGKLIAVAAEILGQRVRCPHCLGIVLAQAPASDKLDSAETTSAFPVAAITGADDSATTPLAHSPQPSLVNATLPGGPVEPAAPVLPAENIVAGECVASAGAPPNEPEGDALAGAQTSASPADDTGSADFSPAWPPGDGPRERPGNGVDDLPPRRLTPLPRRSGVSIWLVLPLISYSILATVLLFLFWARLHAVEEHPLAAFLPDSEGDNPGVIRKPKGVNEARKRKLISDPLPESLIVHLGETRSIGALAVTPRRVVREQLAIGDGTTAPERINGVSLVLFLELKNISADEWFQPLDRYFDRKWREGSSSGPPPLTLLEAGAGERFFGGPAQWLPRRASQRRDNSASPEFIYLMGSDKPVLDPIDRPLGPGESTEVFVGTDGSDPRGGTLLTRKGDFLWRVHLRRGLVRVKGRDVPAAAVIGVAFSGRDVQGG